MQKLSAEPTPAVKTTADAARLTQLAPALSGPMSAKTSGQAPMGWTRSEHRPLQLRRAKGASPDQTPTAASDGPGSPLPEGVRTQMESSFSSDFSSVRVHEGGQASALGAAAYTQGSDIHFAPGRLQPSTQAGQELLGHELAHVVQQGAGRVSVPQGKDANINADPGLEAEADRAGAAAARGEPAVVTGNASGLQLKGEPGRKGKGTPAKLQSAADKRKALESAYGVPKKPAVIKVKAPAKVADTAKDTPVVAEQSPSAQDQQADQARDQGAEQEEQQHKQEVQPDAVVAKEEEVASDVSDQAQDAADQEEDQQKKLAPEEAPKDQAPPEIQIPKKDDVMEPEHVPYYQFLASIAPLDGKAGLFTFFDDLKPATKSKVIAQLLAQGVLEAAQKGPYKVERWAQFKSWVNEKLDETGYINWNRFADISRACQKQQDQGTGPDSAKPDGMTTTDMVKLGITAGGGVGSGAKALADMHVGADKVNGFNEASKFKGADTGLKASQGLGVSAAGLGILGDGMNVLGSGAALLNKSVSTEDKLGHGLDLVNHLSSMQQNTTNMTNHASKLAAGNNMGVMSTAALGTALGVGAIVGGTATLGKGVHDIYQGQKHKAELDKLSANGATDQMKMAAEQGSFNQGLKRDEGIANAIKGAAMITGGALLIALGVTNPVGAIILGAASAIGGIMAAVSWWKKRKRKHQLVDEHFNVDAKHAQVAQSEKGVSKDTVRNRILQENGFNSIDNYNAFYSETMATYLHGLLKQGVDNSNARTDAEVTQASELVRNLGLKVDFGAGLIPNAKEIGKRL